MDIAQYEGIVLNISTELSRVNDTARGRSIEKYRRIAEKGALTCPFCGEKLTLRAGNIREIHFAHLKGKTCQEADAYDTYQVQTRRENLKHSGMKEAIYNELKSQEVIKPDLKVEYGYKEKAAEKWRHYPDIYMKKDEREFAISVITNVHKNGDEKVVKEISRRNKYFEGKGLETIWFVEDRELADDLDRRVLHLWEAEYELAIKTKADRIWDLFLKELMEGFPVANLYDVFEYRAYAPMQLDVRSLYYVHSTENEISFSVYRMILDEKRKPFRAFALTQGYRMHMSNALIVRDEILLSIEAQEDQERIQFTNAFAEHMERLREGATQEEVLQEVESSSRMIAPAVEVIRMREHDVDVLGFIDKLKAGTITGSEAKTLYQYLVRYNNSLPDYGLNISYVKDLAYYMLGKINDASIRTWLVEIREEL